MQHEVITAWAREKFKLDATVNVNVEQETESSGYCETCYYEEEVWRVRRTDTNEVLYTWRDDFASLLKEVLDFASKK